MKGERRRDRLCNHPEPQNGGKDCSELGEDSETKTCTPPIKNCPGNYKEINIYAFILGGGDRWGRGRRQATPCFSEEKHKIELVKRF